jgi:hypothetical protein
VLDIVRNEHRRPFRRTWRVKGDAALLTDAALRSISRLLHAMSALVVRSYASARSAAGATSAAAPHWHWNVRGAWSRRHVGITVYLSLIALAILVGWFVSTHVPSG